MLFKSFNLFSLSLAVLAVFLPLGMAWAEDAPPAETPRAAIRIAETNRADPVDFEKELLPVLKNNCLACHNQTKAKADLVLETPQTILKGGESGPAVVPGKSGDSLLLKMASHQEKPHMPPKDNKVNAADLTPEQLGLLKLWIDQGAQGEVRATAPVQWQPLAEGVNPIYAVALTPDGQFAACSRANRIFVYHIPSGQFVQNLMDGGLIAGSSSSSDDQPSTPQLTSKSAGVAHLDLVHSLAFSPDGNLLASGGYREVKLWRRTRNAQKLHLALSGTNAVQSLAVSPDGKWLATASADGSIQLRDPASGMERGLIVDSAKSSDAQTSNFAPSSTNGMACLKFSPGGTRLGSVAADKTLRVWTVPAGELLVQTNLSTENKGLAWVAGPVKRPESEAPSLQAPESIIATGGADKLIRIWQIPDATNGQMKLVIELKGHEGAVTCLDTFPSASSASGGASEPSSLQRTNTSTLLLSGSVDGSVRLWDLAKGERVREMNHGGPVTALAIRSDGKRFASAGLNNVAKLWSAEDGKLLAEMKGDRYPQEFLAETERNSTVAKNDVSYRKDASEGAEKQEKSAAERVSKGTNAFAAAATTFGEKQKLLQAATESRAAAEKTLADLNAELKKVTEDYQAADKTAKQAAADGKAELEKATQAKLLADQAAQTKAETERLAADSAAVASKSKAAAGTNLADSIKAAAEKMAVDAAAVAEKAKAFAESTAQDAATKSKLAADAKLAAEKAIDEVAARSFALGQMKPLFDKLTSESPEKVKQAGEKLTAATNAVLSADKEFKKAEQAKSTADHELQLAKAAAQQVSDALAQARTALQSSEDGQKKAESEVQNAKKAASDSEKPIRTIAFSPDNLVLASAGDDGKVHTWSAESGGAFETLPAPGAAAPGDGRTPGANPGSFNIAFAGAKTLVTGSADGLTVWDLNPAWKLERTIGTADLSSPLVDRVNALRFSPDGIRLATGGGEPSRSGEIILWNVADGKKEKEFSNVHSDTVLALDFSPDGKYLASGGADRFVKVTDLASGKVAKSFEGHLHHVLGVSWKRDGRTLASSGADNVVKVWDFVTGERKKNIEGFNKEVTSIAFIDATDQALASSGDNQVRLVRENGDSVRTFSGETDYVYSAMATPDGKIVVAGGQDSMLRVWNGLDGKTLMNFPPPDTK